MSKAIDQLIANRMHKLAYLEEHGVNPYPNNFKPGTTASNLLEQHGDKDADELAGLDTMYSLAGRIMTLRVMGKAAFLHIKDRSGSIQLYVKRDVIGEEEYRQFKRFEVGDIVGATGTMMKTRTGELSLQTTKIVILSKALRPMPEKFHGLQDIELRFRQRYLDLFMNDWVRELFVMRSKMVRLIRNFLDQRDFLEVETPMMQSTPGGAAARPFSTHHNALDIDLYLRIAPELYLKRLLVGGLERVYEINRNFRNEGLSHKHNPEFTMLEFYWAYATYDDLMDLTEQMISSVFKELNGTDTVTINGQEVSLAPPFKRLTLYDSLIQVAGIPAESLEDEDFLRQWLKRNDAEAKPGWGLGKLQMEVYDKGVEPGIVDPTFIINHPVETSPLSRRNEENPSVVDRFELVIGGREIVNAFSELNDPRDQRGRFEHQAEAREKGDDEAHVVDEDFLRALEFGMPPAAGEGIGIDRLVMLAAGVDNIKEVILFPLLRPEAGA
jgi:lysyl-tRNA synthetase, class II